MCCSFLSTRINDEASSNDRSIFRVSLDSISAETIDCSLFNKTTKSERDTQRKYIFFFSSAATAKREQSH